MRWYEIPQGTVGKLIIQKPNRFEIKDWVTRKDLAFSETILDPVRLFNRRGDYDHSNPVVKLVLRGYALYSSLGSGLDTKYILAVPYEKVKVS